MRFAPVGIIVLFLLGLLGLFLIVTGGPDNYGGLFLVMGIFALVNLVAVIALGVWLFPRVSRELDSPVLGCLVGLPIFLLLAAAIVMFFFATCYGILVAAG